MAGMQTAANPRSTRAGLGMIGLTGIVILVVAAALTVRTLLFLHTSVATKGTVISNVLVAQSRDDGEQVTTNFAPKFSFIAADGKTYTVVSVNASSPPEFAEGEQVRVLYNPLNPNSARIDSFWQLWFAPILFGALGVVASAVGYMWIQLLARRDRELMLIRQRWKSPAEN